MVVNIGSIGSLAYNRIANIPSTISIGSIVEYVTYGLIDVENYVGVTIDTANIPKKYQNIAISIGCMYTLSYMLGANVDFDTVMGEFHLTKSDSTSPEFRELEFYKNHINESLKVLSPFPGGASHLFTKVYGV